MTSVERAAMKKGTWSSNGWDEGALVKMSGSGKYLFNFYASTSTAKKKRKRFEQMSWETIYCKLKEKRLTC
eukprot:12581928-Ditylum_brightwellii.AAC.1